MKSLTRNVRIKRNPVVEPRNRWDRLLWDFFFAGNCVSPWAGFWIKRFRIPGGAKGKTSNHQTKSVSEIEKQDTIVSQFRGRTSAILSLDFKFSVPLRKESLQYCSNAG